MASEAASPADGDGAKKEVSNEKLKKYIHQLRAKVKKLEEELVTKTEELEASGTSSQGAPAEGADTGLIKALREEIEVWKANYQQQVEASASAVSAAPDAEESGRLADALQEAREEASLWKEKASATEQLQDRLIALEEELKKAEDSRILAERTLKSTHEEETTQLEAVIESLRLERTATVDANQENVQRLEEERQAAEQAAAELRTQVEDLLSNAGTLEHRLVNTQQERDEAVSRSSDLEQEAQRLASDVRKAKEDMAKASGERDAEKEAEDAERVEQKERRKEEIEQLQHALSDRLADLEQLRSEAHENHVQQQEKQQEQDNLLEKSLAEADALRSEVDELRAAAESEALKVEQETDEEGDQTEALEQAARAREEAAAQLAEATGKISELEERVGQLVEELDGVRKAEGEATDQADALKAMVDDMKDDMERERQRAVDLKEERDTAVKDKDEAGARNTAATEEAAEKFAHESAAIRKNLEEERDALSASLSEMQVAKSAADEEAASSRDRIVALEEQLDALQRHIADSHKQVEETGDAKRSAVGSGSEAVIVIEETEAADEPDSSKEAALLARCECLEREAEEAVKKIAALETKLSESIAAAAANTAAATTTTETMTEDQSEKPNPSEHSTPSAAAEDPEGDENDKADLEVDSEAMAASGDGERGHTAEVAGSEAADASSAEEGEQHKQQRMLLLETQLREAQSLGQELRAAAGEMDGVLSGLREEKAALEDRLRETTTEITASEEAAALTRKDLAAARAALEEEQEKTQRISERAEAAEALVRELEEKGEAVTRGAGEEAASLREKKMALEAKLEEAQEEVSRAREALAASSASTSASVEEASDAASKAERERSDLEEQVTALKEKIKKAVARMRSLKGEKDAAIEELASTSSELSTSQKKVSDLEIRCQSLEEALAEERTAAAEARHDAAKKASGGGERLQAIEEEMSGLRLELDQASKRLQDADRRASASVDEADRLREEVKGCSVRLEGVEGALRLAEESAARMPAVEDDLKSERDGRRELEGEMEAVRDGLKKMDSEKASSAKEVEEIMGALQGQVDMANKDRDEAVAGLEKAESEKETSKTKLREVVGKFKAIQAKLNTAQEGRDTLQVEAEKLPELEEKRAALQSKVEELESKVVASETALSERQEELVERTTERDDALQAAATSKEEMDGKVKRLKTLLHKLQKSSQSKDADLAALKAPPPPPKEFSTDLRVRHDGSVWCLITPTVSSTQAAGAAIEGEGAEERGVKKQWVTEDKARAWMAGGSSSSDDTLWPPVVQDEFGQRAAAAAAEAEAAAGETASTRAELEKLASDFSKYKARAHTALKKATSNGADDKRKDDMIASLQEERDRLGAELTQTAATLEAQLADARASHKAAEDDLESMSEQLETAQEEVRELEASVRDQQRKVAQLQEGEDGHSEELSALRDARDELKTQLKAAKTQADESSCIVQEELDNLAKERDGLDRRGSGAWDHRSDGGWAGNQMLATSSGLQNTGESPHGFSQRKGLSDGPAANPTPAAGLPSVAPASSAYNDGIEAEGFHTDEASGRAGQAGRPVKLMALAELERRHNSVETQVQAEVSEMRTELAEALLRVEQLSAQEAVLKDTVRTLETELKTERDLGSGEAAPINVAYLKSAVVRYMSTRDAGEQRSLLRVISTILQLTRQEVAAVEIRIAELEKTMVGRAGSMVGGAGRRVGGVVGGVVGLVWRGPGRAEAASTENFDDIGVDGPAAHGEG